jgi:hypothetical protein
VTRKITVFWDMTPGEDGESMFLRNVGVYLPYYRDSLPIFSRFVFRKRITVLGST